MRLRRSAATAGVLALAILVLALPGIATAEGAQPTARVRIAHLSPDASYVDVYAVSLNRDQVFPNVFYKAISAYWGVAAGAFTYEVRPAGADPAAPARVALTERLRPGRSYTVAVVGPKANLRGLLLGDDLSPVRGGKARVRFVDTLVNQRGIDVVSGGKTLAKGLTLGSASQYGEVAPGKYRIRARLAGAGTTLFQGTLNLQAGTVTTAILTGGAGKPDELYAVRDAAGARDMPTAAGGVATGAGGTAPASPARPWNRALRAAQAPHAAAALPLLLVAVTALRSRARVLAATHPPAERRSQATDGSVATTTQTPAGRLAGMLLAPLLLAGCAALPASGPAGGGPMTRPPAATDAAAAAAPAPAPTHERPAAAAGSRPSLETSPFPTHVTVPGPPSAPVQLTIESIGIDTRLVRLGLDARGALEVPGDFSRAGWFTGGPVPGEQGPAVIAGHVDSRSGPAVFYHLRELAVGDIVQVRRADGVQLRFTVQGAHQYPKAAFPKETVFGTVSEPVLRLVTCGGSFDRQRHSYRDNLVIDATLSGFSHARTAITSTKPHPTMHG
jgi:hypothetical protein